MRFFVFTLALAYVSGKVLDQVESDNLVEVDEDSGRRRCRRRICYRKYRAMIA